MPVAGIIAICLFSVAVIISAVLAYREFQRAASVDWRTLKGGRQYVVPVGWTGPDVQKCFDMAVKLLKVRAFSGASEVDAALANTSLIVMAMEKWRNVAGQWVGGQTQQLGLSYLVQVEKGMSSLCHELAHVMEYAVSGVPDYEHAGWADKGLWEADEAYRAWLKEQTS